MARAEEELLRAKFGDRLTRVPAMLVTACLLAGFGFLLVVT